MDRRASYAAAGAALARALSAGPHSLVRKAQERHPCRACHGTGSVLEFPHIDASPIPIRCAECNGTGEADEDDFGPPIIEDDPPGWDDPDVNRYGDEESVADGFEEQW